MFEETLHIRKIVCSFDKIRKVILALAVPKLEGINNDVFPERVVYDESGKPLDNGLIKACGAEKILIGSSKLTKNGLTIIYRWVKLKRDPDIIHYSSLSGKTKFRWKRTDDNGLGKIYGTLSKNAVKVFQKYNLIGINDIPLLKIETITHLSRFKTLEKFIIEKYLKLEAGDILDDPAVHAETSSDYLTFYVEASKKDTISKVDSKIAPIKFVRTDGILGVIIRFDPHLDLRWRKTRGMLGKMYGRVNLYGLKILIDLGIYKGVENIDNTKRSKVLT